MSLVPLTPNPISTLTFWVSVEVTAEWYTSAEQASGLKGTFIILAASKSTTWRYTANTHATSVTAVHETHALFGHSMQLCRSLKVLISNPNLLCISKPSFHFVMNYLITKSWIGYEPEQLAGDRSMFGRFGGMRGIYHNILNYNHVVSYLAFKIWCGPGWLK